MGYAEDNEELGRRDYSKVEFANKWIRETEAAVRVKKQWMERFKVAALYQYYEGFQWSSETDENNRPYVINMIYSSIETKLPNLIFNNPQFNLRPRPMGEIFDMDAAITQAEEVEDAVNYVCCRKEFGLNDKHELAILDAFFGFGVLEVDYSQEIAFNPYINKKDKNPLNYLYAKHIPFDHFFVSSKANWDLSEGRWWGYYEFVDNDRLVEKYPELSLKVTALERDDSDFAAGEINVSGKITTGEHMDEIPPVGTSKVWYIWDFSEMKKIVICEAAVEDKNRIIEYEDFEYSPISVLRFGKRRKGWYPLPPVFNWIHPQDEINEIRQASRVHRKRFSRKYAVVTSSLENEEELDKFLYGPDGTVIKCVKPDAIKAIEDPQLDSANQQSLIVSYDDFNRISGTSSEARGTADRMTAHQATIIDQRAQVRESKDQNRVGNFLVDFAGNLIQALGKAKKAFWVTSRLNNESLLSDLKPVTKSYKKIDPSIFRNAEHDITVNVSSISPVYAQEDKRTFMEFLAVITQYEILSFSPGLIREAAYRIGYKNEAVLNQFMQMAQVAMIGRQVQAKAQLQGALQESGIQPTEPGKLPQQQVDASTPPDSQQIMNTIFNRHSSSTVNQQ